MDKPDTHFHSNAPFSPSAADEKDVSTPPRTPRFYRVSVPVQPASPALSPLIPNSCRIITSRCRPLGRDVNYVVECCENHQHYDERKPDAEPVFLRAIRQRTAANGLDRVEHKVTAIEQRYWEQVQENNRDRQHRGKMHQRGEACGRDLTGYLSDTDRPAQLIGRLSARNDTAEIRYRAVDHEPGFLEAETDGLERPNRLKLHIVRRKRAADTQNSNSMEVAETVLDLFERRSGFERDFLATAINGDRQD